MQQIILKTSDNIKIALNHYHNGSDSVIIICPGWFMTKDSQKYRQMAEEFNKFYDVISMDFRGHGKSGGFYTFTANEEKDLDTVVNFAKNKYKRIYLCGLSLGGALVLLHGAKTNDIDKIIAISAPDDFMKIENHMYSFDAWYPTLFQKFEPKRWISIRPGFPLLKKERPIDLIDRITVPTLFMAGEKDPTVFPHHTKNLYDKARCPKKYKLFEKARHAEDLYTDYPEEFIKTCIEWLN